MSIVLRNLRLISTLSGEYIPADIEIQGERIRAIMPPFTGRGEETIDCTGKYATYGFADAHFHSESTMLSLPHLAEILLKRGTTAIYINPHEVANVGGLQAMRQMLDQGQGLPLRIFIVAPCKVPTAPQLEQSGAVIGMQEVEEMLGWPETVGIGELDAFKLIELQPPAADYIACAREKGFRICGSVSGFSGTDLQQCVAAGITDDHESTTGEEALEKLRLGCCLHVREGSAEHNLDDIMGTLKNYPFGYSQICFCCDDRTASDLLYEGHIDHCIRKSIALGIDPIWAYRMGTYNTAAYYRNDDRYGLIAPGKVADLVLVDDLEAVHVTDVFFGGRQLVQNGELLQRMAGPSAVPANSVRWKRNVTGEDLAVFAEKVDCILANVVKVLPGQIRTQLIQKDLPVQEGVVLLPADREDDIQFFTLAERYKGEGRLVNAFVSGFGLQRGAIAGSISHDHHHLVSVGVNREDMAVALNRVAELGGGLTVALHGKIIDELPLPLWGLLSDEPGEETAGALKRLRAVAEKLGYCGKCDPFAALSLVSLPVIPEAGFTDRGLIDTVRQKVIPIFAGEGYARNSINVDYSTIIDKNVI